MNHVNRANFTCFFVMFLSVLAACSQETVTSSPLAATAMEEVRSPTTLPRPTLTPRPIRTATLTVTMDPTQPAGYATAVAAAHTEAVASRQAYDDKLTKAAQFSTGCDETNAMSISPDEKWIAASCGYKRNQRLIVQSKDGTQWVLDFKDFLHPDSFWEGTNPMGGLYPKFWGPDGTYLYFITIIGYDGGGNLCFPYHRGNYGLFRLNLSTGSWVTLIPPTNRFPGYGIQFSPTGRRYATDVKGVMIADLNTGEVTTLDVSGIVEGLSWSPDGTHLAYSVGECGEEFVESSSAYVWDAATNQTQLVFSTNEGILLKPEAWMDDATLRIKGEKWVDREMLYTIYIYDIAQSGWLLNGTATPHPR